MGSLGFTDAQKKALRIFRSLVNPETAIRVVLRAHARVIDRWRFMAAMPVPTPAPFPLYDCQYDITQEQFARIGNIPPLDQHDIETHHCLREKGWINRPPGFAAPKRLLSMHSPAPTTFINEREYEIIKTVRLTRNADYRRDGF